MSTTIRISAGEKISTQHFFTHFHDIADQLSSLLYGDTIFNLLLSNVDIYSRNISPNVRDKHVIICIPNYITLKEYDELSYLDIFYINTMIQHAKEYGIDIKKIVDDDDMDCTPTMRGHGEKEFISIVTSI